MLYFTVLGLVIFILLLFSNRDFLRRLFGCRMSLTIKVSPENSGVVTPSEGKYDMQSRVTVTAIPRFGWHFNRWEGDISGFNNPKEILMDRNKKVVAIFIKKVDRNVPTVPHRDAIPSRG